VALGICVGAPVFYSSALDVKSFCMFFAAGQFSLVLFALWLHYPFRHHSLSSSFVDEFNKITVVWPGLLKIACCP